MRLRTEIGLALAVLLLLQIVTSFGASGLLARVSPAVEQILEENVRSVHAVEEMLSAIALDGVEPLPERQATFEHALEVAQTNITEEEEKPHLEGIQTRYRAALEQPGPARRAVVRHLRELSEVNQQSMQQADDDARRIGLAGSWAAVLLGLLGFGLGLVMARRLVLRIERPVAMIDATLQARRHGDRHRRCHVQDVPAELERLATEINRLLDATAEPPRPTPDDASSPTDRAALRHLLEQTSTPRVVVAPEGTVRAANTAAHALFADEPDLRRSLARLAEHGEAPGWEVEALEQGGGWVCSQA